MEPDAPDLPDFLAFSSEAVAARGEAVRDQREPSNRGKGVSATDASRSVPGATSSRLGPSIPWRAVRSGVQFKSLPTACPLLRLHEEILDFAKFMSPTKVEEEICDHALSLVLEVIRSVFPAARTEIFGSRANGLVLPTSDWDLVLFNVSTGGPSMRKLGTALERSGCVTNVEIIESARVPIVKVKEKLSGIAIDITFGAVSGQVSRALINDYVRRYPVVRPLVMLLKYFLIQRGLNETYSGGVGSFLLVLMVVHVVKQNLKELRAQANSSGGAGGGSGSAVSGKKRSRSELGEGSSSSGSGGGCKSEAEVLNGMNLGALLLSFFELYGFNLNYATTGISVRGTYGGYFKKASRGFDDYNRPFMLTVENPIEPTIDVGRNSWNVQMVRRACAHAHTSLARAIRQWNAHNDYCASRGAHMRAKASDAPPSILATIIHTDPLLDLRGQEVSAEMLEGLARGEEMERERAGSSSSKASDSEGSSVSSSSSGSSSSESESEGEDESRVAALEKHKNTRKRTAKGKGKEGKTTVLSTSSEPTVADEVEVAKARSEAMDNMSGSGLTLRHTRLLADIFTRKERKVEELAKEAAAKGTWY